jgi:hypothetical protein
VLNQDGYLYHSQKEGKSKRLDQFQKAVEKELEEEAIKAVAHVKITLLSPLPIRRKRATTTRKQKQLDQEVEERRQDLH